MPGFVISEAPPMIVVLLFWANCVYWGGAVKQEINANAVSGRARRKGSLREIRSV